MFPATAINNLKTMIDMTISNTTSGLLPAFLVGIAPGARGGLAAWTDGAFACQPMPPTVTTIMDRLCAYKQMADLAGVPPLAVVEQAAPMHAHDAEHLGYVLGACQALGFQVVGRVRPEIWQAPLREHSAWRQLRPREFQAKLLVSAQGFFPGLVITPGTAVALMLVVWKLSNPGMEGRP